MTYVLTKTICAVDETPLPGWTGFNTMLDNKKHDISKVGYLPVINASPTEYSTINAILTRSKEIADKFQLKYAVLVFDEAVYSKIEHIHWKEPEFYERFFVRQGEFHIAMSSVSAMSKVFEDEGLKVKYIFFTCSSDNLTPFDRNIEAILYLFSSGSWTYYKPHYPVSFLLFISNCV